MLSEDMIYAYGFELAHRTEEVRLDDVITTRLGELIYLSITRPHRELTDAEVRYYALLSEVASAYNSELELRRFRARNEHALIDVLVAYDDATSPE